MSNVVVIDNGTGYTKMGYAGNEEPTYVIPSVYAGTVGSCFKAGGHGDYLCDLDFAIGREGEDLSRGSKSHPKAMR